MAIDPIAPSAAVFAKAFSIFPIVAGAIAQGDLALPPQALSRGAAGGGAGLPCGSSICEQQGLIFTRTITLSCLRDTEGGAVQVDGTIVLTGQGTCDNGIPAPDQGTADIMLTADFKDAMSMTIFSSEITATGPYALTRATGLESCGIGQDQKERVANFDATLTGMLGFDFPGASMATLDMHALQIGLSVGAYDLACFPIDYALVLNGAPDMADLDVNLVNTTLNFQADFNDLTMTGHVANEQTSVDFSGAVDAICFDGIANLVTPVQLVEPTGQLCPTTGTLQVLGNGQFFYTNGAVDIDDDLNGTPDRTFNSCVDSGLFLCVG